MKGNVLWNVFMKIEVELRTPKLGQMTVFKTDIMLMQNYKKKQYFCFLFTVAAFNPGTSLGIL